MKLSNCCSASATKTNAGRPSAEAKPLYECSVCGQLGAVYGKQKKCKIFTEDCYNHPQCLKTLYHTYDNMKSKKKNPYIEELCCCFEGDHHHKNCIHKTCKHKNTTVLEDDNNNKATACFDCKQIIKW